MIKQLKGSVNWDDGIENEMNLCVSVRVGEYFWGEEGKGKKRKKKKKKPRQKNPQTETDATQWS